MKSRFFSIIILCIIGVAAVTVSVSGADREKQSSGMATLYFRDARLASYSFTTADFGRVHRGGDVFTGSADLDAGWLNDGKFTIGIKDEDKGRIIDLGDDKITDTGVGRKPGEVDKRGMKYSIYHSLRYSNGQIERKFTPFTNRWKTILEEKSGLYLPGKQMETAEIKAGHIYIMRLTDKDGKEKCLIKLRVIEFDKDNHVTFLWQKIN